MELIRGFLRAALFALLVSAIPGYAQEERTTTYTWIDENGQRVYSDRPRPGSGPTDTVELELAERPARRAVPAPSSFGDRADQTAEAQEPLTIALAQPVPEQTYVNTGFRVQVSANVQPALPQQGRVAVYLDGSLTTTGRPGQQSFVLEPVYRGAHRIFVVATDQAGQELARSEEVTFYVRQASARTPP